MLRVKLLSKSAKAPTVAHPGEDLGYDIYAAFMLIIPPRSHAIVATAIAIECTSPAESPWAPCCATSHRWQRVGWY